ncbi:HutD family protein [Fluviicola sp.]|jgi:environmental stress-induced protein Ves|uniref:HutD/Ves family protein n=1 Tax=Fluviicola sp. TaxID=1917219 RepID=UPI0028391BD1|nr:HutD family protein [Fluviicola sp.]MDR0803193.1 HutD family protein [Fluviicola sp.]
MKVLTAAHFQVSSWSGGTTTQLYIFPEEASLEERNFDWRISSAVIETEESEFSSFEGYERILIPLKGHLEMEHLTENGILKQSVRVFELARFSGSWKTTGKGKLTDFNLIFKPDYTPVVSVHSFEAGERITWEQHVAAIYLHQGVLEQDGQRSEAPAFILNDERMDFVCSVSEAARLIIISI